MSSSSSAQQSSASEGKFWKTMKAAISSRPTPYQIPICDCGFRMQVRTSYTERNPCRRFTRCENVDCRRFTWIDESEIPTYSKNCLNILLHKFGELATEFQSLETKHGQLAIELERLRTKDAVNSSNSSRSTSRSRHCDDCMSLMLKCKDLEILLVKKEKEIVMKNCRWLLVGIVVGFMLLTSLVLIAK